jgi:hypothetical protein
MDPKQPRCDTNFLFHLNSNPKALRK